MEGVAPAPGCAVADVSAGGVSLRHTEISLHKTSWLRVTALLVRLVAPDGGRQTCSGSGNAPVSGVSDIPEYFMLITN